MKREEQTVKPKMNTTGKSRKQRLPANPQEAEQRATELPDNSANVSAELKTGKK
jgi:hypothetical protein